MKNRVFLGFFLLVAGITMLANCSGGSRRGGDVAETNGAEQKTYRFEMIAKVVHPWFDRVEQGARVAADSLAEETGNIFEIVANAPANPDVDQQNELIDRVISRKPDGIFVDLVDPEGSKQLIEKAISQNISVVTFDSASPSGLNLTEINNDFAMQSAVASEKLAEMIGYSGKVAIMQGVPSSLDHKIRTETHRAVFEQYPDVEVVAEGIANGSVEQAQAQANSILSAHPDLDGFVASDFEGPIGIGAAIREAGKSGEIFLSGLEDLPSMLELMNEGIMQFSVCSKPSMQGHYSVLALWQSTLGLPVPRMIDTGIGILTPELAKDPNYSGF